MAERFFPNVILPPDPVDGLSYDVAVNAARRFASTLTAEQRGLLSALGKASNPERTDAVRTILFGVASCDAPGADTAQDALVLANVRYALGRMSFVVSEVIDLTFARWGVLSERTRAAIRTEVAQALADGRAGMDMDEREWRRLLAETQEGAG